jgi:hypothetical protein
MGAAICESTHVTDTAGISDLGPTDSSRGLSKFSTIFKNLNLQFLYQKHGSKELSPSDIQGLIKKIEKNQKIIPDSVILGTDSDSA